MALLDVSELMSDPDFTDAFQIISRAATVSDLGENSLEETPRAAIGVVEAGNGETLKRLPEGAQLSDWITVYTKERLVTDSAGGYADVVVWGGLRYQVQLVTNWKNFGTGYVMADCIVESVGL